MKRVEIAIEQVIFEHSPLGLRPQLSRQRGVCEVEVDAWHHVARITYDDAQLSVDQVRRLVDGCGYGYGPCTEPVESERAATS